MPESSSQISRAPFPEVPELPLAHGVPNNPPCFLLLSVLLHLSITGSEENDPQFQPLINQ